MRLESMFCYAINIWKAVVTIICLLLSPLLLLGFLILKISNRKQIR
ncbi:hypothetical protein [Chitinophaga sp. 212800010-3]|nr:hypothetical protein [Chitinophaga sp. 212800010-3]